MPTHQPDPFSPPLSKMPDDHLFELPSLPPELADARTPPPTFEEQLAHAQLLLSWRETQGLESPHPPRNAERFVMGED